MLGIVVRLQLPGVTTVGNPPEGTRTASRTASNDADDRDPHAAGVNDTTSEQLTKECTDKGQPQGSILCGFRDNEGDNETSNRALCEAENTIGQWFTFSRRDHAKTSSSR